MGIAHGQNASDFGVWGLRGFGDLGFWGFGVWSLWALGFWGCGFRAAEPPLPTL